MVAFVSNFRTALSTTRSFAQGRARNKGSRYKTIALVEKTHFVVQRAQRIARIFVLALLSYQYISNSLSKSGGVLPLCLGVAASIFLKFPTN